MAVVFTGFLFAEGEADPDGFLALIPLTTLGIVLAISTFMHGLKNWWDKQDKLNPYWWYFAVLFSLIGATIVSIINGFDWAAPSAYITWIAQVLVIYGGEHVVEQAWFKKWWPIIKQPAGMFLKWILKK